ncbi:MAG: hypothetical protein B7X04_00270 [Parcubacteria group bacterium 21-54-25]|nr:MAG: hypothetical protein B7X04_00270 [Parcubacteria group bacterium 21-54-25]HQU07507.1 hypothetical protein [Candidatus Paceibacterota bacterium]
MTAPTDSLVKKRIMRRIQIIHAFQSLVSGEALATALFAVSFVGIAHEVALAHVFANMPNISHLYAFDQFWLLAFEHTRRIVQALTIMAVGSALVLARAMARLVMPELRPTGA